MKLELLQILECPFCGGRLRAEKAFTEVSAGEITTGILLCECSAYPVLAGIPFMRTGRAAERAMALIGSREGERALGVLLGLDENDSITLRTLLSPSVTFREALALLDRSAEVAYFLYRFSDPTFIASQAVLLALTQDPRCRAKHILDIGGGTGHLSRSLCRSEPTGKVILADVAFWKVFLAKMFIAPACQPVCCDANHSLPFARETFSLVNCSDAFHYIWSKRQLAAEMQRLIGLTGIIVVSHLHNALSWNPSQGNPLSPEGYATLFHGSEVGLFDETPVRQAALHNLPIDLSLKRPSVELQSAPALLLIATALDGVFVSHEPPQENSGRRLLLNPLYAQENGSPGNVWSRRFPSADYEEECAACKDYLPERIELSPQQIEGLQSRRCDVNLQSLARRRVLLDLPDRYV